MSSCWVMYFTNSIVSYQIDDSLSILTNKSLIFDSTISVLAAWISILFTNTCPSALNSGLIITFLNKMIAAHQDSSVLSNSATKWVPSHFTSSFSKIFVRCCSTLSSTFVSKLFVPWYQSQSSKLNTGTKTIKNSFEIQRAGLSKKYLNFVWNELLYLNGNGTNLWNKP